MRTIYPFLLVLIFSLQLSAQNDLYSRIRIDLTEKEDLDLARLGVDLTHGIYASGRFFISDFSQEEIQEIQSAGFATEVLIEDVQAWYLSQDRETLEMRNDACSQDPGSGGSAYEIPDQFSLGSMAGFYTYQEMLDILDEMAAQYPHLITFRAPIEGVQTIEERPIYWLRISDNPELDEVEEPEILYTALHHAREPNSLTQLIFYMWYLLENYETDPEVKFLVDHTAMYFIPCLNPDGYIYNETTNPDGGGMWRKNRRDNGNGTFGVDLNRNYGHFWGYNDSGSSPNPASQVYRGAEPFSEPETQAVREFCNQRRFQVALNYHTFSNLLIYPWGYSDTPTEDAPTFNALSELMTLQNGYFAGTGSQTVGYTVNGGSDDWMYGETTSKPAIFAMTPEVGAGGFWPSQSEIMVNCQATMFMNLSAANVVHPYGMVLDNNEQILSSLDGDFRYHLRRYGLQDGPLTVSISSVSDNIATVGAPKSYNLDAFDFVQDHIAFTLNPGIQEGEEVVFLLSLDNGGYVREDTVRKIFSVEGPVFSDMGSSMNNWTVNSGTWGLTNMDYFSAPSSIADSPFGNYQANANTSITLDDPVDLQSAISAKLYFWAKWDIEAFFDYAQLQIEVGDSGFFPVCGKYTKDGSLYQDLGNPVYDGIQDSWVLEEIDLTEYLVLGDQFRMRFVLVSDVGLERDGFYFDDVMIIATYDEVNQSNSVGEASFVVEARPNPARGYTVIEFDPGELEYNRARLVVYNGIGQPVLQQPIDGAGLRQTRLNTAALQPGIYYYRIFLDDRPMPAQRLAVFSE
jgi:carboxypeptidase T